MTIVRKLDFCFDDYNTILEMWRKGMQIENQNEYDCNCATHIVFWMLFCPTHIVGQNSIQNAVAILPFDTEALGVKIYISTYIIHIKVLWHCNLAYKVGCYKAIWNFSHLLSVERIHYVFKGLRTILNHNNGCQLSIVFWNKS